MFKRAFVSLSEVFLISLFRMFWKWDSAWTTDVTSSNLASTIAADTTGAIAGANPFQGTSYSQAAQNIFTSPAGDARFSNALQGKTYLAAGESDLSDLGLS